MRKRLRQTRASAEERESPGSGERPREAAAPPSKSKSSGRVSATVCRLCHGRFSPRSLRHAFVTLPEDPADVPDEESDGAVQSDLLFHTDFQQLVGVPLDRDPHLSDYICKKCHAKFYKCHNILKRFLQRVNLPLVETEGGGRTPPREADPDPAAFCPRVTPSFSSDSKCLHRLVSWAHHHAEACRYCPNLKEVLEGRCLGSVRAVWGCVEGHCYTMDARCSVPPPPPPLWMTSGRAAGQEDGGGAGSEPEEEEEEEEGGTKGKSGAESDALFGPAAASELSPDLWSTRDVFPAEVTAGRLDERQVDGSLSERAASEDVCDRGDLVSWSDAEQSEPSPKKRSRNGPTARPKAQQEPKVRKKPGPKPGWKKKFKTKGEELPNIYKCPYAGCTAVYKAPEGLKKHIREHHEEVRERPCPHPGCNKVFMIDRYLQRHLKLIHTEERNYICDQCGQTFKQRKHLSVHQLRHSGAKPLQCEVCGFQCRQRASLKYHMTKHKAEADLEFACVMCRKRFEKAHNLNVHMSMVHPLIHQPPPPSQLSQQDR
ncbi:zinc finger protein 276 isoform X2 [Synchiropus splendidus]|uniref:zinc finger protein 276 isoform X2 n=1 Tax=Synchiropus splendidus TaxID=270530 RepID=UPI00237D611E|nr:zinc finger protein 276 isoform X2 [Synchiropus splendidus]